MYEFTDHLTSRHHLLESLGKTHHQVTVYMLIC